jgi:hypothetical protein
MEGTVGALMRATLPVESGRPMRASSELPLTETRSQPWGTPHREPPAEIGLDLEIDADRTTHL